MKHIHVVPGMNADERAVASNTVCQRENRGRRAYIAGMSDTDRRIKALEWALIAWCTTLDEADEVAGLLLDCHPGSESVILNEYNDACATYLYKQWSSL